MLACGIMLNPLLNVNRCNASDFQEMKGLGGDEGVKALRTG